MTNPPVIAMFGLSGVGKGWIARELCARRPEVLHLEASALLSIALSTSSEALRTATADVLTANQRSLVSAFIAARCAKPFRPVLFDGHSVIDNDAGLVDIPTAVILELRPCHIVFVSEDVAVIAERRSADARKRPARSLAELDQHQRRARSVAKSYAADLHIPFEEVRSENWMRVGRVFAAHMQTPHLE